MKRCADVGADIVRITVQGMQEAKACGKIRDRLFQDGCATCNNSTQGCRRVFAAQHQQFCYWQTSRNTPELWQFVCCGSLWAAPLSRGGRCFRNSVS